MTVELWGVGLFLILLIALFFYLILRIMWAVVRGVGALLGLGGRPRLTGESGNVDRPLRASFRPGGGRLCPNPLCQRTNVAAANYCAQCGQRL